MSIVSIDKDYDLKLESNYLDNITFSIDNIFSKYEIIINEYIYIFFKTIHNYNTEKYKKYLFINGIKTVFSIFNFLIYYTKNINLTIYYTNKACYYYIEFISQIENINNNFLQLNGKDASMFVYKKTIFELNHTYIKESNEENIIFENIKIFTEIYNLIIELLLKIHNNNLTEIINLINNIKDIYNEIFKFKDKTNYNDILKKKLLLFKNFIEIILYDYLNDNNNNNNIILIIDLFINKLKKNINIKYDLFYNNIIKLKLNNYKSYTPYDIINFVFKLSK